MSKIFITLCVLMVASTCYGQFNVRGTLSDTTGQPVAYATIAFLSPVDSTLQHYGISDEGGGFIVKAVNADSFLMQVAGLEYQTWYKRLFLDEETDLGKIVLRNKAHLMNQVVIVGEKIPLMLKGDTVEYNAGAFKTRLDAAVEELLRKLPGVEVDRAGNIKAQGEGVSKVLVDGKEFFGNDPKVATKNLPADAVRKVQVYDGKSDQAQFSGIDDGSREKTINLELKDNKKKGYFGSLMAGGGTDERYQMNGKLYRFRKNSQLAVLGMMNNINEFGFSMDDYLNFQGGLRGLMGGGGDGQFRMSSTDNLPVNFGQTVTGLISSGAGGLNYMYEPEDNKRFSISYMGNASDKHLDERSYSRNFTPSGEFERDEDLDEHSINQAHRVSVSARNDIDSSMQVALNGGASYLKTSLSRSVLASSYIKQAVLNNLDSRVSDHGSAYTASGRLSFQKKWKSKTPLFKISGAINYRSTLTATEWQNTISYPGAPEVSDAQFQDDKLRSFSYSAGSSLVRSLGGGVYLEPGIEAGSDEDAINRTQGFNVLNGDQPIDSLSPVFSRRGIYIRPGLSFQSARDKRRLRLAIRYEAGDVSSVLNDDKLHSRTYGYFLPSAMWRKELSRDRNLEVSYSADVELPTARQMLPVVNASNPLQEFKGNSALRPEYQHQARINWLRFDQFNLSSLFANASFRYTYDKINWSRTTAPDLSQQLTMVNVQDDYQASAGIEYSTPIRKLGITLTGSLEERYQRGINIVNSVKNQTTIVDHSAELKIGNRKKDKWDVQVGASVNYTDARYSIHSQLNTYYYNIAYFGEISYRPNERLYFMCNADVNSYYSKSFNGSVSIPLLKAEASWFFLKANRASLTLTGFDLLNSNTGLERISELNYLMERKSNIIGQYFMLSLKYRLSQAGEPAGRNVIKIGR